MTPRPSRRRWLPVAVAVAVLVAVAVAAFAAAAGIADRPGAVVEARGVPLLIALGGGALGLAAALVLTARVFARGLAAGYGGAVPTPRVRRRLRFAVVGPALLLAVLGSLGVRWYGYVTGSDTPFDEVGVDLNARVPGPLRRWGCDRLKARFAARTPPPSGCGSDDDPARWR